MYWQCWYCLRHASAAEAPEQSFPSSSDLEPHEPQQIRRERRKSNFLPNLCWQQERDVLCWVPEIKNIVKLKAVNQERLTSTHTVDIFVSAGLCVGFKQAKGRTILKGVIGYLQIWLSKLCLPEPNVSNNKFSLLFHVPINLFNNYLKVHICEKTPSSVLKQPTTRLCLWKCKSK